MSSSWSVVLGVVALVVIMVSRWLYQWSNPKCNGKLPPGSMGLPFIGETLDFFKSYGFYEISPFLRKRMLKYGTMFRTNLFGSNTVVLMEPDVIYEVFRQENKSFILRYPEAFVKSLGKDFLFLEHGNIHKYVKQITLQLLGSEALKRNMIKGIDKVIQEHLRSKANQGNLDVKDTVESLIMAHLIPKLISNLKPETKRYLMENIKALKVDWFSSLFTLATWISLYKTIMAGRAAMQVIKDAFRGRKTSREKCGDFMDIMVQELEKENVIFNEATAINLMFGLLVISKDSTSVIASLAVKFIAENPKALAELMREHVAILSFRARKLLGCSAFF